MHPDKKIIANGDDAQNLPLNFNFNNIGAKNKYLVDCIMNMFDAHIILRMNKRLKDPKDREKLADLKRDIFDLNLDIIKIFEKYDFKIIQNMNKLNTKDNISYFRSRSYKINKHVQDNLVDIPSKFYEFKHEHNGRTYNFKYYVGQYIICRQPFKRKNAELYTNYMYEILGHYPVDKHIFKIKSKINEDKIMYITKKNS